MYVSLCPYTFILFSTGINKWKIEAMYNLITPKITVSSSVSMQSRYIKPSVKFSFAKTIYTTQTFAQVDKNTKFPFNTMTNHLNACLYAFLFCFYKG